ncbi:MAG: hypothetical protein KH452_01115 [Clostridiales bacterium]|nr:hypothetical protein [Clostridiales bacterium]
MKMKKKIWKVIGVAVTAASLTACTDRRTEYKEQAVRLLEEKYGESFQIYSYLGREYLEDYYKVTACPEKSPDLLFEAKAACDGSYISDEYLVSGICRRAEEQIKENLGMIPGYLEIKVCSVMQRVKYTDTSMSVSEFVDLIPENSFVSPDFDACSIIRKMKERSKKMFCVYTSNNGGDENEISFRDPV